MKVYTFDTNVAINFIRMSTYNQFQSFDSFLAKMLHAHKVAIKKMSEFIETLDGYVVIYNGINYHGSPKTADIKTSYRSKVFDLVRKEYEKVQNYRSQSGSGSAIKSRYMEYFTTNLKMTNKLTFIAPYVTEELMNRFPGKVFCVRNNEFTDRDIDVICAAHILAKNKIIPEDFEHYIYTNDKDYHAYRNFKGKFSNFTIINYRITDTMKLKEVTLPQNKDLTLNDMINGANDFGKVVEGEDDKMFYLSFLESALSGFTKYHDDIGLRFLNEAGTISAFDRVKDKLRNKCMKYREEYCEAAHLQVDAKYTFYFFATEATGLNRMKFIRKIVEEGPLEGVPLEGKAIRDWLSNFIDTKIKVPIIKDTVLGKL